MVKYRIALLALALPLALPACTSVATTPPAPLENTTIDEKGLIAAWEGYDALLSSVDVLVAHQVLTPGTPRAKAIQTGLVKIKDALTAASAARRAGSASSYASAITEATAAFASVKNLLKG